MARHKNADWNLPEPQVQTWQQANTAVLMDIRDELQRLNALLHCGNFVRIPQTLHEIKLNTTKKLRKPKHNAE